MRVVDEPIVPQPPPPATKALLGLEPDDRLVLRLALGAWLGNYAKGVRAGLKERGDAMYNALMERM